MTEPTAVIFDLDNTLYAERRFALSGYAAVARHLATSGGPSASELFRALCQAHRRGRRAAALQDLMTVAGVHDVDVAAAVDVIRSHPPRLRLPRTTRTILGHLRARGHRLGILTNGLPSTQRGKVAALGVDGLVDSVVYAQEYAPAGKPDPACFRAVLRQLGVEAARAVFVGDHPEKDVAGAHASGLHTIWMQTAAWSAAPAADASALTLHAIPALVERLLETRDVAVG